MWLILKLFKQVYKNPVYIILVVLIGSLILFLSIWLQNSVLLTYIFGSELFSWESKIEILWSSIGTFKTNFSLISRIIVIVLAILGGINISLLIYFFKNKVKLFKTVGTSSLGLIIGLLGSGCGICGSVVLSSIFGISFTIGFISWLPLSGLEFGLLGITFILISIYLLAKQTIQPKICSDEIIK